MLGEEQGGRRLQGRGDAVVHLAQPGDRGEKAECAAPGRLDQRREPGGDLAEIVARDVGDDEDAGLFRVVEGRGDARAARAFRQVAQPSRRLGRDPGEGRVGLAVGQCRRGHDDAVRRLGDGMGKRDAGVDPVAVERDVGLGAIIAVERQPLDGFRLGRLGEVAEQAGPGAEHHVGAAVERADRRVEALALASSGGSSGSSS